MRSPVLLLGGAGFVGAHVAAELLDAGDEVVILDSFTSYHLPLGSSYPGYIGQRLDLLRDRVTITRGDASYPFTLRRVIDMHRPDRIVQLAGFPLANISGTHSEETIRSIVQSTMNTLEIVRDVGFVRRFLYISSSMVYGDFQYTPADEEHPKNPREVYGGAKLAGEALTRAYGRQFGIEYVIVRPSAVYGPTDMNRRVSQLFVEAALEGRPVEMRGGDTALDFTYVKDIARGIALAVSHPAAAGEVFNMTRGEGRTLREFTEILIRWVPDLRIVEHDADPASPRRGALDVSRARELLGYDPEYSLERGLEEYISFLRQTKYGDAPQPVGGAGRAG